MTGPDADLLMKDAALAAATNGIVIVDALAADRPIVYVNPGFERLTGYGADEVLGRNCRFLQGPGTDPSAIEEFRAAVAEHRSTKVVVLNHRKDGTPFWNEVVLSPIFDGQRVTQYVGVQLDVTERRQAEDRAEFLAYHDPLTGLANRARLQDRLAHALRDAGRKGRQVALLHLDLDDLKGVNDRFGHVAGDELLRQVTERLGALVRPRDVLARQGGDEFLIVLTDLPRDAAATGARVAERVQEELRAPFLIRGDAVEARASVGVSAYPADAATAGALLQHADAAMYAAKRSGDGVRVFGRRGRVAAARVEAAPTAAPALPAGAAEELDRLLCDDLVRSVYQPIVDIDTGGVVAYEALARGPEGSVLERPDRLFAAAAEAGRTVELEWACRIAAVRGALDGGLRPPFSLFLNVEPSMIAAPIPERFEAVMARARQGLHLVLELTERALTDRPGDVLEAVPRLRKLGCAIALDDVGADRRSLALMPFLQPEIIKLDLRLVQSNPTPEIASIVHAVNAKAERTGALLLAEGIENEEQREVARALGARYAQGWLFGRPGPLPVPGTVPAGLTGRLATPRAVHRGTIPTPFEVVSAFQRPRRGTKRLLFAISKHLEAQVSARSDAGVLLATFQEARHFTPKTEARYRRLAQSAAFVGALGVGLPAEPAPGVRGAALDVAEPLRGEWNVVVLDPHFAAAFVARDLGDEGCPDWERRFDFCLTYDRDLVVRAAEAMMSRVAAIG
jgi:diguanylate cyclase (GGDEF)-like protein/PAS domain S-box-containing protein